MRESTRTTCSAPVYGKARNWNRSAKVAAANGSRYDMTCVNSTNLNVFAERDSIGDFYSAGRGKRERGKKLKVEGGS